MESIVYTRTKQLCNEKNISLSKLETELSMGTGTIIKWKNSKFPTVDKIYQVAKYFGVSVEYMIGATDIRSTASAMLDDPDCVTIQRARERMSDHDKMRMMGILKIGFDYAFKDEQ